MSELQLFVQMLTRAGIKHKVMADDLADEFCDACNVLYDTVVEVRSSDSVEMLEDTDSYWFFHRDRLVATGVD